MKKYLIFSSILLALFFVSPVFAQVANNNCLKEGEEKSTMPLPGGGQDERVCCPGLVFKSTVPFVSGLVTADADICINNPIAQSRDSFIANLQRQLNKIKWQILILIRTGREIISPSQPVACTMEVRICPDGVNYVGRTGPKCEFELCPGQTPSTCKGGDQVKCHPGTTTEGINIGQ